MMSSTQLQIVWLDFRDSPCWTFSATLPAVTLLVLSDFKEHHQKARDHTGKETPGVHTVHWAVVEPENEHRGQGSSGLSKSVGSWEGRCLQIREGKFQVTVGKQEGKAGHVSAKPKCTWAQCPRKNLACTTAGRGVI